MSNAHNLECARRLIGQHPAALRSVCWTGSQSTFSLHHLEVETKHGRVTVFDHQQPRVYCNPPRPDAAAGPFSSEPRQWRDLTEQVPVAFNGRPVFADLVFDQRQRHWRFHLSTGAIVIFVLDPTTPLLLLP